MECRPLRCWQVARCDRLLMPRPMPGRPPLGALQGQRAGMGKAEDPEAAQDPVDALQQVAWEQGIKVQPATYDSDSEEETWEDAMGDLQDPWMRDPPGDNAWEAFEQEAAISEGLNNELGPGTDQRWQELSWEGLQELQMSGKAVQVISLDKERPAGLSDNSMKVLHVPLETLTADKSSTWHDMVVAVVDTGDYKARQACIRLTQVHGVKDVRLVGEPSSLPEEKSSSVSSNTIENATLDL